MRTDAFLRLTALPCCTCNFQRLMRQHVGLQVRTRADMHVRGAGGLTWGWGSIACDTRGWLGVQGVT